MARQLEQQRLEQNLERLEAERARLEAEMARRQAEEVRLAELKAQGRKAEKHRNWEQQVLFLKESDEKAIIDAFFEKLMKRLNPKTAQGLDAEDFAEFAQEHTESLSLKFGPVAK